MGLLPPVVATFLADTKGYTTKVDQMIAKNGEFLRSTEAMGAKFTSFGQKLSGAVIGAGVAFAAFGVHQAIKLQEALDKLQNQSNITASQLDQVKNSAVALSDASGKSATDIIAAWQVAENAGLKFSQAQGAVDSATKLTVVSGGDLIANTKALIAAQELGITKGMSYAKVADIFLTATKGNVNGISSVVSLLQGKVGAAFAAYHQSAGEAVLLANVLSGAQYTNTRALSAFVNKMGEFNTNMLNTTVSGGKLKTSVASWVNHLISAGLNVDKVKTAFTGPDGLINGLKYLQTVSHGSLTALNRDLISVFGTAGAPLASLLIKHLPSKTQLDNINNASGTQLNKSFTSAMGQLGNMWKKFWATVTNDAGQFGMDLLPGIKATLEWFSSRLKSLSEKPLSVKIEGALLGTVFAAAIGVKILSALNNVKANIQAPIQTGFLEQIAANTALTAERLLVGGAGSAVPAAVGAGVGGAEAAAAGGASATFARAVPIFAAGAISFEATSMFLKTSFGQRVGNFLTAGGGWNPINDLAAAIHQLSGNTSGSGTTGSGTMWLNRRNEAIIASHKPKGKTTINVRASVTATKHG